MKKYLFIILLVGVCLGQNTYPYFSDMKKQSVYEKSKLFVYIPSSAEILIPKEIRNTMMADEFLKSNYQIKRNKKILEEEQYLKVLGLEEELRKILLDYNQKMKLYNQENLLYNELLDEYNEQLKIFKETHPFKIAYLGDYLVLIGFSSTLGGYAIYNDPLFYFGVLSAVIGVVLQMNEPIFDLSKPLKPSLKKPTIKEVFNYEQAVSMVEAYNRKLFSEIAKK